MAEAGPSSSNKIADFKARLAKLHTKRNEATALNHKEVVEENRQKHQPKNAIKKRERLEAEFEEMQRKEAMIAEGKDYDRERLLEVGANEAERWERKKKKKNPDSGFSTYEDATIRQYNRLQKNKKVDMDRYDRDREAMGEDAFYCQNNTIPIGLHTDTKDDIDAMVQDLEDRLQNERNIPAGECTMTTQISISSTKEMQNSTRNWNVSTDHIQKRSSKIWREEQQFNAILCLLRNRKIFIALNLWSGTFLKIHIFQKYLYFY